MTKRPVVLCILDGVGWGRRDHRDAVFCAQTPTLDHLMNTRPWGFLKAHGTAVGMPSDGDMGNSEVGHNAMGAGRVFAQGAKLVQDAIKNHSIWNSAAWQQAVQGRCLHLLGLLSDGNVHSHIDHLLAMISRAHEDNVATLRVHILTDGRDVSPRSALQYIATLEDRLAAFDRDYQIASGGGRMYITMDRYGADWDMVKRGWDCHVHAHGRRFETARAAVQTLYDEDPEINDQWLAPFVIGNYQGMQDGDAVLLFNFRGDRAIEISRSFEERDLDTFDRGQIPDVFFAGMMEYDGDLNVPKHYLVPPPEINDTVGDRLAAANNTVLSISETQKFGHVTFFFNGNRSGALPGETQLEVPSIKSSFRDHPEMSALEILDKLVEAIHSRQFNHIRVNFANGDMVGHTGDFAATVKAVETLDLCLAKIWPAVQQEQAILLVTADHGNADEMVQVDKKTKQYKTNPDGSYIPSTSHSKNLVPFILCDPLSEWTLRGEPETLLGGLAQIGGTLLHLSDLEVPSHYLPSLLEHSS